MEIVRKLPNERSGIGESKGVTGYKQSTNGVSSQNSKVGSSGTGSEYKEKIEVAIYLVMIVLVSLPLFA